MHLADWGYHCSLSFVCDFCIKYLFIICRCCGQAPKRTLAHSKCNADDDTFISSNSATVYTEYLRIYYLFISKNMQTKAGISENKDNSQRAIGCIGAHTHASTLIRRSQEITTFDAFHSLRAQRLFAFAFFTVNRYYCSTHFMPIIEIIAAKWQTKDERRQCTNGIITNKIKSGKTTTKRAATTTTRINVSRRMNRKRMATKCTQNAQKKDLCFSRTMANKKRQQRSGTLQITCAVCTLNSSHQQLTTSARHYILLVPGNAQHSTDCNGVSTWTDASRTVREVRADDDGGK